MHLSKSTKLKTDLENLLKMYQTTQQKLLSSSNPQQVENNITLNLFLFSLVSFCESLIHFEYSFNKKEFQTLVRIRIFLKKSICSFLHYRYYKRIQLISNFKVTVAIFIALLPSIYIYGFDSTAPAAITYVMGSHLGMIIN